MSRRFMMWSSVLFSVSASVAFSSCDDWECGYGGPGCGRPGLVVCEGSVTPDTPLQAEAQFYDDTGGHPATVTSAQSATPAILSVSLGTPTGRVLLNPMAEGVGRVTLEVQGWKGKTFTWSLEVVSADGGVSDGGTPGRGFAGLPDGGTCVGRTLALLPDGG